MSSSRGSTSSDRSCPLTVSRTFNYASLDSLSARHTRCGEVGMSMCRTPRWLTASITAFCTAGVAPIVPASPMPLARAGCRWWGGHVGQLEAGDLSRRQEW